VLVAAKPTPDDLLEWGEAGVTELIWGVPDRATEQVVAYLDRLAERVGL